MKSFVFSMICLFSLDVLAGDFFCAYDGTFINLDASRRPIAGVKKAALGKNHFVHVAENPGFGMRFHRIMITDKEGKIVAQAQAWLADSVGYEATNSFDQNSRLSLDTALNGKSVHCVYGIGLVSSL